METPGHGGRGTGQGLVMGGAEKSERERKYVA